MPKGRCTDTETQYSYSLLCGDPDDPAAVTTRPAAAFSAQTALLMPTSTSKPSPLQNSTAAPAAPITAQESSTASKPKNENDEGLSTTATIAIGVILPTLSIIVAVIFGVRMWNSGHHARRAKEGFTTIPMHKIESQPSTSVDPRADDRDDFSPLPPGLAEAPLNEKSEPRSPESMRYAEMRPSNHAPHPPAPMPVRNFAEMALDNRGEQTLDPRGVHELPSERHPTVSEGYIELPENSIRTGPRYYHS